jgi:hypothetical protein
MNPRSCAVLRWLAPALVAAAAGCVKSEGAGTGAGGGAGDSSATAGGGGSTSAAGTSGAAAVGGSMSNAAGTSGDAGRGGAAGAAAAGTGTAGTGGTVGGSGAGGRGDRGGTGGTTGVGGNVAPGSLTLSGLKIDPNPRMTLSCYVSWTTSAAASSEVQFGAGGYQLHVVDANLVTSHRVHVVGMHAETAYQIKAISTTATATGDATGTFTTGKLPTGTPKATVVTNVRDKIQPGWTLTNAFLGGTVPAIIVMVDADGLPVWYFVHGKSADQFGMTSVEWLSNGHVLIGNASAEPAREIDLEANVLWEGPTGGSPAASHHTGKTSAGNYLIVRESNATARVEELSPTNQIVWTWDLYSTIKPKTTAADWCHLNSVTVDVATNVLYFNCRYQGLFKVNRADKSILWQMGAAIDDAQTGDVKYLPDNAARFNDSHDPEIHDDGTILFYDNQGWTGHTGGEMNGSLHTQVVEYMVDEAKKQATLTWRFPGTFAGVDAWYKQSWATPIWGDANRLANGNVLVTAGNKSGTTRHFEVTRAGEVVWAIDWANVGSYRGVRISPAPATPLP